MTRNQKLREAFDEFKEAATKFSNLLEEEFSNEMAASKYFADVQDLNLSEKAKLAQLILDNQSA